MADPIPAAPAAPAAPAEGDIVAQVKGMVNLPETATDLELITVLVNIIANLQEKYEGLLADAVAMEDEVANRTLQDFSDVVPEAARPFWKEQILRNRAQAVEQLTVLRTARPAAPAAAPAPPAAPSVPLVNRLQALPRSVATLESQPAPLPKEVQDAVVIRNRAHQISKAEGISFLAAFARAEREFNKE